MVVFVITIATTSVRETKEVARLFAKRVSRVSRRPADGAAVFALSGELGSGKTAFAQGFARALGVKEKIKSPTFVLMKIYDLRQATSDKRQKRRRMGGRGYGYLVHIDCYRIQNPKDLLRLGVRDIFKDPSAIVLIEWPERVKKIIPRHAAWIRFKHGAKCDERRITISGRGLTAQPIPR